MNRASAIAVILVLANCTSSETTATKAVAQTPINQNQLGGNLGEAGESEHWRAENVKAYATVELGKSFDETTTVEWSSRIKTLLALGRNGKGQNTFADVPYEVICSVEVCFMTFDLSGIEEMKEQLDFIALVTDDTLMKYGGLIAPLEDKKILQILSKTSEESVYP